MDKDRSKKWDEGMETTLEPSKFAGIGNVLIKTRDIILVWVSLEVDPKETIWTYFIWKMILRNTRRGAGKKRGEGLYQASYPCGEPKVNLTGGLWEDNGKNMSPKFPWRAKEKGLFIYRLAHTSHCLRVAPGSTYSDTSGMPHMQEQALQLEQALGYKSFRCLQLEATR